MMYNEYRLNGWKIGVFTDDGWALMRRIVDNQPLNVFEEMLCYIARQPRKGVLL